MSSKVSFTSRNLGLVLFLLTLGGCLATLSQRIDSGEHFNRLEAIKIASREFKRLDAAEKRNVVQSLINALQDEHHHIILAAAQALTAIGPEAKEAVPELIQALKKKYNNVNYEPPFTRNDYSAQQKSPPFIDRIPRPPARSGDNAYDTGESDADEQAGEALIAMGHEAVPALIGVLRDPDNRIRYYAAYALGRIKPSPIQAIPALIETLEDKDPRIRVQVVRALGSAGPDPYRIVPVLIRALKDENAEVYYTAVQSLGKSGQDAVPVLTRLLDSDDPMIRYAGTKALGAIGAPAIPAMVEAGQDKNPVKRYYASRVMGGIPVSALINSLSDKDAEVRYYAAEALGRLSTAAAEAVPALTKALKDEDRHVRRYSVYVLGSLGKDGVQALPAIQEMLRVETDPLARDSASEALLRLQKLMSTQGSNP